MQNFKLIALTPLKGCSDRFSKKLNIGYPYKFYRNYKITLDKELKEIIKVTPDTSNRIPDKLYELKNGINLSISAIIGKNGTGKSTLMEILYQGIYMLATHEKFYNNVLLEKAFKELEEKSQELKGVLRNLVDRVVYLNFSDYGFDPGVKSIGGGHGDIGLYVAELNRHYELGVKVQNTDSLKSFIKCG